MNAASPSTVRLSTDVHRLLSALAILLGVGAGAAAVLIPNTAGWIRVETGPGCLAMVAAFFAASVGGGLVARFGMVRLAARCPVCNGRAFRERRRGSDPARYICRDCGGEKRTNVEPVRIFGGLLFSLAGSAILGLAIAGPADARGETSIWVPLLGGTIFLLAGLLVMGVGGPAGRWLGRRFPPLTRLPWGELLGGGLALLAGAVILALGFLTLPDEGFPSGRVPVILAGGAFLMAGLAILLQIPRPGAAVEFAQRLTTALLLVCFGGVPVSLLLGAAGAPAFAGVAVAGGLAGVVGTMAVRRFIPDVRRRRLMLVAGGIVLTAGLGASWLILRPSPDAAPPPGADRAVTLRLSQSTSPPAQSVRVEFSQPLVPRSGERFWVAVAPAGSSDGSFASRLDLEAGCTGVDIPAPDRSGAYEVRLHACSPIGSDQVVSRAVLFVRNQPLPAEDPHP